MENELIVSKNMQNIIIAGNGPSLKNINYKRLPREYDVFRCNQFYFEDKYYLGKKIKAVFFNPGVFLQQYHTAKQLILKNEYEIKNIFCSTFNLPFIESNDFLHQFYNFFPDAKLGYEVIENLKEFYAYIKYNEIYFNKRITSGVYMCAIAIALGYKTIYLCGIDFYEEDVIYPFEAMSTNIKTIFPGIKDFKPSNCHSKEYDIEALKLLKSIYKVNIYALCDDSILANHFPLSININNNFTLENKHNNSINDILLTDNTPGVSFYKNQLKADNKIMLNFYNILHSKDTLIKFLNKEIAVLKKQTTQRAKARIQNHLSYKLGQALIINSKSVLGFLSLPFIILSIVISHKQEQKAYKFKVKKNPNLALPPLETYPDYNEALKEKECFTYKLGEEFIKAGKNWYGEGYIKFIFKDVPRLKREFEKGE
ncbi:alpha-2,3-sialyltransferase [Campylobacter jejuni]|nr:alpha-2,3-sialyltransferase [Campylobacter jejuni]EAH6081033.1 alpha-2,3-sialyltransferase [Campylobacter jejuni]EAI7384330.1 alpha-2,3-sialyltransferase [Campylobacter jejuni]EAI7876175.1 alpha-2,3-sialyltransferase [Campylobacter jejuni]EAI8063939.1 alpha-2,3-sialyltransferase [Campylobacter jejuni]